MSFSLNVFDSPYQVTGQNKLHLAESCDACPNSYLTILYASASIAGAVWVGAGLVTYPESLSSAGVQGSWPQQKRATHSAAAACTELTYLLQMAYCTSISSTRNCKQPPAVRRRATIIAFFRRFHWDEVFILSKIFIWTFVNRGQLFSLLLVETDSTMTPLYK